MIRSGKLAGVRTEFQYKKRKFAGIVQKVELISCKVYKLTSRL